MPVQVAPPDPSDQQNHPKVTCRRPGGPSDATRRAGQRLRLPGTSIRWARQSWPWFVMVYGCQRAPGEIGAPPIAGAPGRGPPAGALGAAFGVAEMNAGERQQCEEARALQGCRQPALVLGADPRLAAGLDLCAIGEEATQARGVLVIDNARLVDAERTDLATRTEVTSAAPTTFAAPALATRGTVTSRAGTSRAGLDGRAGGRRVVGDELWCNVLFGIGHDEFSGSMGPGGAERAQPCNQNGVSSRSICRSSSGPWAPLPETGRRCERSRVDPPSRGGPPSR